MRIEAQGKYLQKIIEEQQKLGGALKASETLPLDEEDKQKPSESEPPGDASAGPSSPRKKQKVDDVLTDGFAPSSVPTKSDQKNDFVGQWDRDFYGSDAGFGLDLGTEFKEGDGVAQRAALELGPLCGSK
jgi:hypothetical protein